MLSRSCLRQGAEKVHKGAHSSTLCQCGSRTPPGSIWNNAALMLVEPGKFSRLELLYWPPAKLSKGTADQTCVRLTCAACASPHPFVAAWLICWQWVVSWSKAACKACNDKVQHALLEWEFVKVSTLKAQVSHHT